MRFFSRFPVSPRTRQGLIIGLLCGFFLAIVRTSGRLEPVDRSVMDTMFELRGSRYPSPDIVMVQATDEDVAHFGGWPFRRRIHAQLVRRLKAAGVKTIAFDVLFTQAAPLREDDIALAQATHSAGNVVHAMSFNLPPIFGVPFWRPTRPETMTIAGPKLGASGVPPEFGFDFPNVRCREAIYGSAVIKGVREHTAGLGHLVVAPEWDGALRRIPNLIRYQQPGDPRPQGGLYPSLALAAALHFLDVPREKVEIVPVGLDGGSEIRFPLPGGKIRRIPINSNGETMINWVGPNRTITTLTLQDTLNPNIVTDDMLKGKVVLIGITAAGAYEHQSTPFSPNEPAVELQANGVDDILNDRVLHEAPLWLQLLLLFALPILACAALAAQNAKSTGLMLAVLCFGVYTMSGMLLAWADFYLPVGSALFGAVMACVVAIGYRQVNDAASLRLAEERYALAVRGANDGLWDWNLITNTMYYSPRWKEMMGCDEEEITNTPDEWFRRVHPDHIAPLRDALREHIAGKTPHFEHEYQMLHKNGTYRWMLSRGLRVKNEEGRPTRMAGSHTDITDRKRAEKQLHRNAFYDNLTGLPNRALFINRLEQAVGRAQRRADYKFAVLFLDLDRFKNVNDSLGHSFGDELIKEMAKRIASCLRLGDTPARVGGDEFTILLDDIEDVNDATRVAERFQQELSQPTELNGQEVVPSVSVGIALSTTGYQHAEDVLRDADIAVARAKALGTGRREIFDTKMHERAVALLRIESDLRRALEKQTLAVHYQTIVALESGRIAGFEALARWPHPARGMVSPGDFIPIAEDTGLIVPVDQWVLRESCRQFKEWEEKLGRSMPLFLSVNLSSKQFSQGDVAQQVGTLLKTAQFDPRRLKLEITESALMDNTDFAASMLHQMRDMGIQLAIDDFGTGYSSLSYLHRFPLDTLKIDRSFVTAMSERGEVEIVRAIITLAKNFAMSVVAEGVETMEQMQILRDLGCDYGQGYYFSRPLTGEAAFQLLDSDPHW